MSVRVRATSGATAIVGLAFLAASLGLVRVQRDALTDNLDELADLRAEGIAALIVEGTLPASLEVAGDDDEFVRVASVDGSVVAETPGFLDVWQSTVPATTDATVRRVGAFRITALRATPVTNVYVASGVEPIDAAIDALRNAMVIGGPLLLMLVAGVTWLIVGRSLKPVDAITRQVSQIHDRSLDRRVPVPTSDDEIGRLAVTMNSMLARLESSVERQKRFVADASHELKTPLAALRVDLETTTEGPQRDEMLSTTSRMERLINDLLYLARATDDAGPRSTALLDLDDIVLEEVVRSRAAIDTSAESGAAVIGNRDDLARVVRNLLDNALRHRQTSVAVSVRSDDAEAVVTVADDGPGVAHAERERIFERFARGDDVRDRSSGGTGLGLAIAREIVTAHGGSIAVEDGQPGARFVVRLPLG